MNDPDFKIQRAIDAAVATTIDATLVAHRLEDIRSFRNPELFRQFKSFSRMEELLWFLQGLSWELGAEQIAAMVIQAYPDRIATRRMQGLQGRKLTLAQRISIWTEMDMRARPTLIDPETGEPFGFKNDYERPVALTADSEEKLSIATEHMDLDYFRGACRDFAAQKLPDLLVRLCIDCEQEFTPSATSKFPDDFWFFPGLIESLFQFMDLWAKEREGEVVMTVVTKKIYSIMDKTLRTGIWAMIRGNSRFGKTESIKAFCRKSPGLARLIELPESNSFAEFLWAVANALGISPPSSSNVQRLRDLIANVLRQSKLLLIFDEGHFLIPRTYTRRTSPPRLDWIRRQVFDKGHPVVVCVTPQWFDDEKSGDASKFERVTHYVMQQVTGRWVTFILPDKLPESDLIALVKHYLPEIPDHADQLEIASYALASDNYIQAISIIAKLARDEAQQQEISLSMALVRATMQEIFPDIATNTNEEAFVGSSADDPVQPPNIPEDCISEGGQTQ